MINRILKALEAEKIEKYLVRERTLESTELFFIKKKLDTRRMENVHDATVTIYNSFETNGRKCMGDSSINIEANNSYEIIVDKIRKAYHGASFVPNAEYALAEKVTSECIEASTDLAAISAADATEKLTNAVFENDTDDKTFVNSFELFVSKTKHRIINSNGVDVSYIDYAAKGEFVCQSIEGNDVETYKSFEYDTLNTVALSDLVKNTLKMTRDRAKAVPNPVSGSSSVILSDDYAGDIFTFWGAKASAPYIYLGYFDSKIGDFIQSTKEDCTGDIVTITTLPTNPFSSEGTPMIKRTTVEDGVLKLYEADCRYASYMNIPVTGNFQKHSASLGSTAFDTMKEEKGLYIVNFSDFQVDPMSGHFRGEIRLAYYNDGEKIIPVTGGSVNGDMYQVQKDILFSKEEQNTSRFKGPKAVLLKNVQITSAE